MAHLLVRKGANPGYRYALEKDTVIIGRSIDCDMPIASPSVSRQHARLLCLQDRWYIEDMLSRNGTHVNEQRIAVRTPLKKHDHIRICDFEAIFQEGPSSPTAPAPVATRSFEIEPEDVESSSQLMGLVSHGWKVFEMQSAENLRTILHVSNRLSSTLELDQLLPKIGDQVFNLFPNAERCFVVVESQATGNLVQEVTRTRSPEELVRARYSRSIVRQCAESKTAYLSEDVTSDRRSNSGSSTDMQTRSIICAPLCTAEEKVLGAIQLDTQDFTKKFVPNDLKLLVGLANQATIALQNAQLYQEMQKQEQIERDLELAAQVQRSILPANLPKLAGFEFHTHYSSALQVGGDYFDFIPLSDQRLAITLGDVAGKSVPAAILMAKLSSDVRSCLLMERDLGAALTKLNNLLYRHLSLTDRLVTFVTAVIDAKANTVTLVNAGHCAPLLFRNSGGTIEEAISLEKTGVPLGVLESPVYGVCTIHIKPGDSLIFFTDGVTDALSPSQQLFKLDGILSTLRSCGPSTPRGLVEKLVKALERHAAGHPQYDDITMVAFGQHSSPV